MIALDTNILVRFLLKDGPAQFKLAVDLLSRVAIYTASPAKISGHAAALEKHDGLCQVCMHQVMTAYTNFLYQAFTASSANHCRRRCGCEIPMAQSCL